MFRSQKLFVINPGDTVAVALCPLSAGETLGAPDGEITLKNDIPFGHKVALSDIGAGENVIKYAQPIGRATRPIARGEHVHTHNLATNLSGLLEYRYRPEAAGHARAASGNLFFDGYLRPDGSIGVRNEIWIVPTVGCVNNTARLIAEEANRRFAGMTDGVFTFAHNMGCSQLGDDLQCTQRILKGLVQNPNAGGVLVLSLGCENNNLDVFRPMLGDYNPDRVKFLITQQCEDEIEAALALIKQLVAYLTGMRRRPIPVSKLVLGLKCGGSDAFSGITANALCGRISDRLTALGGTAVLTEVPEMFGAETLLMARAVNQNVFGDCVRLINNFKSYFIEHNQPIYENPAPGNKAGGITTLEEKSLGCIQKGGRAPVVGILDYGDQPVIGGLNLLNGPGNDQVSCTNLTASGIHLLLFTTGRGNPYGAPVPTVKIASNSPLAQRKPHWIDFNAGQALDGRTLDELAGEFFNYLIDVASGRIQTRSEQYGYREISIFRNGVIV